MYSLYLLSSTVISFFNQIILELTLLLIVSSLQILNRP